MKRKKDCTSCVNSIKLHPKNTYIWWICGLHDYRIDKPDECICDDWKARPYKNKFNKYSKLKQIHIKEIDYEKQS